VAKADYGISYGSVDKSGMDDNFTFSKENHHRFKVSSTVRNSMNLKARDTSFSEKGEKRIL
jgi:hypothetical protein